MHSYTDEFDVYIATDHDILVLACIHLYLCTHLHRILFTESKNYKHYPCYIIASMKHSKLVAYNNFASMQKFCPHNIHM